MSTYFPSSVHRNGSRSGFVIVLVVFAIALFATNSIRMIVLQVGNRRRNCYILAVLEESNSQEDIDSVIRCWVEVLKLKVESLAIILS